MPDDDRAAYVRALVAHRCPEIGPADLATLTQEATAPAELLPDEIGRDLMAVLAAMDAKLDALAEAVDAERDDGDDATRRRAGA